LIQPPPHINRAERERNTDKHLGQRLKALRAERALSIYEIADRTGISAVDLSTYEMGIRRMSPHVLKELSDILGVPISNLFEGLE
jgi:transcriptional regulator with XRE-family HTH domain